MNASLEFAIEAIRTEERERCAGIVKVYMDKAESFAVEIMLSCIIEDIRASNAAPPLWLAVADAARAQGIQTCKDIRDGYGASMSVEENAAWQAANECVEALEGAAPPHVEPSAAESDERVPLVPLPAATEARMVELARAVNMHPIWPEVEELAALVIETFGEGK